ncbi:hypothetical protein EHW99_1219 [Erwinia amylovora]|uniref:Uncharacterized protein n=2 Tax=Erwinia amylovora TaxID=552 RepID=A0A831A628_ERWAM|nr:hypothetical protein EHX00_1219 [Erwinia amylovora]CBA21597.1 hypothetical protein predicted by Glimmer/Critica [Erwinia amylovora CFBP1430]CCO79237.1 hypothetical protein BN432_2450 [Erwinia amylovora Ea356]CCO83041.1 hypothetical protein BN433_2481 [Erwinia amylovora Ea266]CCO86807.1 hypothetical protein BN434_2429 [Erwinia amylovora CFBP 2585]CCO90600.1 hypothetical protein BN435_2441 [Erwinia amylovora 01SFR-BO]CCO94372.1 hypothetical protein BN437_2454 [Erwinia amylovora NBRC 12687 = 
MVKSVISCSPFWPDGQALSVGVKGASAYYVVFFLRFF